MIATLARRAAERGLDVFICTADKDARQLLDDQIRIFNFRNRQGPRRRGAQGRLGDRARPGGRPPRPDRRRRRQRPRRPRHRPQDGGEAAPGVRRRSTTSWRTSTRSRGRSGRRTSRPTPRPPRGRQLVALETDLPLDLDWEPSGRPGCDVKALKAPLHRVRVPRLPRTRSAPRRRSPRRPGTTHYTTVDTPEALAGVRGGAGRAAEVLLRHRDDGGRPAPRRPGRALVLLEGGRGVLHAGPRTRSADRLLDPTSSLEALRPALTNPATEKVGQNLKYDMLVLRRAGIEIGGPVTDTMVLSYLLESGERNHNLDQLSQRLLDHTMIPISDLIGKGKNQLTDGPGRGRQGRRLRRRGRRRHLADRGDPRPPRSARKGSGTSTPTWSARLIRVLAEMEARRASRST